LQYRKFGYSDQQVYLSNLLKYKIVTKESIIHLLAGNEVRELPENLPDLLNKIGLDIIQFKEIICKHWNISI
jgi:hypothetical protein